MLSTAEITIALRYLRARQSTRFASFISAASMLGVAIGVAALITILSVMNGFENELRSRLLAMQSQASVSAIGTPMSNWAQLRENMLASEGVLGVAPSVSLEAMANVDGRLVPVFAEGIAPEFENQVSSLAKNIATGALSDLQAGSDAIILGRFLALELGVAPGDDVVLLVPRATATGLRPLLRRFRVVGYFDSGVPEYDSGAAYMHWRDAADLLDYGDGVSALKIRFDDVYTAGARATAIAASLGPEFSASDWTRENASYFRAIQIEKAMMALILSLVIGVAAFNIVASLVMVVTDKETDIAILRTLGLSPSGVVRIFLAQGVIIGWAGVLLGVGLGTLLALNVTEIVAFIEQALGFQVMPGDIYVMTQIPSDLRSSNVLWIALAALTLTTLATIYPARRAASVHPAQALRYG